METYYDYFGMKSVLKFGMFASNEIRQYLFEFNQVRMGVKKQAELWQICLALASDQLSVALSRLFVDTQFNEMQKKSATKVIEKIQNSYENLVKENDWLDAETKNKSLNKLKMVRTNVAYPEWLLDDDKLDDYYGLHDNDLYKRMMAETNFLIGLAMFRANRVQKEIQELYHPIDKDLKWPMPAAIINAAYDPTQNSITIPAGILKSPFFDSRRPFSMNYGAIGVVIGHELTHGLDDEGRQFDAVGNLHSWWNNKSIEQFKNRSECFVKQYGDQLIKEINMHINGRLTLGENIADNGGIHEAYRAFKNADAESASPKLAKLLQYSSDQLFFISFAQVWCGKSRPETLRLQVEYDPHSPMKYRVNVPLSNSADFARTFNCSKGSPMNPTDKCLLW